MSWIVNGLTDNPNILHITQRDFFKLSCFQKEQWILYMCFCSDFNSASARLPCYLSKDPLKLDFLDIYLTTFFGVCKFKNTSAIRVILFLKMFKTESKFRKCKMAVNGLINTRKVLHITQKDFFNRNFLQRDQ